MPLNRPGFSMPAFEMPDDDSSENESDDAEAVEASPQEEFSEKAAAKKLAQMTVTPRDKYDDDSPLGSKRGRAPPAKLERQDSYDVSETMTFVQAGIKIKPQGMVAAGSNDLKTNIDVKDLERVRVLGKGATSRVYLVRHKSTGETFALKELNAMAHADTRRMAINELRIAHRHAAHAQHLIHFVDAFFSGEKICICMELADAGSFDDVIKRCGSGGVPHEPLGAVTLQMLHGLQYLHRELHQVHRDLKPANVMLTKQGVAKLSDFGISKQLESTSSFAMTQVGTSMYMSPERFKGEFYGYPSDLWSVGVIVLEALLFRHPFEHARTFFALQAAICNNAPPRPPEGTPKPICEFIDLCLRHDAEGENGRPPVRTLVRGKWLKGAARGNPQQVVEQLLLEQEEAKDADK